MSKEQIEQQLKLYQDSNADWITDVEKAKVIASFNNRLANTFTGYIVIYVLYY
jgi:hypothetical protein